MEDYLGKKAGSEEFLSATKINIKDFRLADQKTFFTQDTPLFACKNSGPSSCVSDFKIFGSLEEKRRQIGTSLQDRLKEISPIDFESDF